MPVDWLVGLLAILLVAVAVANSAWRLTICVGILFFVADGLLCSFEQIGPEKGPGKGGKAGNTERQQLKP